MAAPKGGDKPRNPVLYSTKLPGGIDEHGRKIIAGTAKWWKPDELPPRKKRTLDITGTQFGGALQRAVEADRVRAQAELDRRAAQPQPKPGTPAGTQLASTVVSSSGETVTDAELAVIAAIDPGDVAAMFELNDTAAWAYLREWTLQIEISEPTETGTLTRTEPLPLPAEPSDILSYPRALYEALQQQAAKIYAEQKALEAEGQADGFGPSSAANPLSPTGGSAG